MVYVAQKSENIKLRKTFFNPKKLAMKIFTKHCLAITLLCVFVSSTLNAQVGVGTTTPNSSAVLDVYSTKKGFLPPRLTSQARDSIVLPANGLMVWCANCAPSGELDIYNGAEWQTAAGDTAAVGPSPYSLNIGDSYLGGVLAYIYQPGDLEYVAGEIHGIVATKSDVGAYISVNTVYQLNTDTIIHAWQITGSSVLTGATDTATGQGDRNTKQIVSALGTGNYAAYICKYYNDGSSWWYLPDWHEMLKLYANKANIGGFIGQVYSTSSKTWGLQGGRFYGVYWTSTAGLVQIGVEEGHWGTSVDLGAGSINGSDTRTNTHYIRPVKRF